jgi:hypothetical protein
MLKEMEGVEEPVGQDRGHYISWFTTSGKFARKRTNCIKIYNGRITSCEKL